MVIRWNLILSLLYGVVCGLATILLICNCFYKFWLDKDASQISFKQYHENKDALYPSVSICFNWPYRKDAFRELGPGIDAENYNKFLSGKIWDDKYLDIDYENVTLDLESYLNSINVENTKHEVEYYNLEKNVTDTHGITLSVTGRSSDEKCLGIDIPYTEKLPLKRMKLKFKNQIFKDIDTKSVYKQNFYLSFHYPSQFLISSIKSAIIPFKVNTILSPSSNGVTLNKLTLNVEHMEVLRRRNKITENCNMDWKTNDQLFKTHLIQAVGCSPPHWYHRKDFRNCSSKKEISRFDYEFHDRLDGSTGFRHPCLQIEKLFFQYKELRDHVFFSMKFDLLHIDVEFQDKVYKEIEYIQGNC